MRQRCMRRSATAGMLLGVVALVTACAGTHRSSAPAPFSRLVNVWQAWDPQGRPFYEIAISLPWSELRQRQEQLPREGRRRGVRP